MGFWGTLNNILLEEHIPEKKEIIINEISVIKDLYNDMNKGVARRDASNIIKESAIRISRSLTLNDEINTYMVNIVSTVNPMVKHIASLRKVHRPSLDNQKTTIDLIRETQDK